MADVLDPETRRFNMSRIKGQDTRPEMLLRRALHARGYRFRLHVRSLPGKPDLILPKYRSVILIQGCFWHVHGCHLFKWPATRREFWESKLRGNQARDAANRVALVEQGWRVIEIWECAIKGKQRLLLDEIIVRIEEALGEGPGLTQITGEDFSNG
ncbi:MAG: very short patch repair endonuclease [Candidatus Melainabacteria bacterium HGW-Melainabacteria-1]|nr:MAG: very short patch repair endonuclease [Candidatus Melainabacteria bacterium HGW-Melainabacteria-1]